MAVFSGIGYPRIGYIINTDLPNIINDTTKFRVFKEFGGFSYNEARQALMPNSLPRIIIKDLDPGVWGHYEPGNEFIELSQTIADQYESLHREWRNRPEFSATSAFSYPGLDIKNENDKWKNTISIARLHIEATILHEIVHWGDLNALGDDGKGADGMRKDSLAHMKRWSDWGHLFVNRAYGDKIGVSKFELKYKGSGIWIQQSDVGIPGWLGWGK